jgi:hypothetical protein
MSEGPVASLKLEASETAVLHAASRIFAAYVAAGKVTPENAREVCEHSVRTAIEMAGKVDDYVFSDGESW